jgi:hypothetical protein
MNLADELNTYFAAEKRIHELFGYQEQWRVLALSDQRDAYWMLVGGEGVDAHYVYSMAPFSVESLRSGKEIYGGTIYTYRHLNKWVYRTPEHVMVLVNTGQDLNQFLMVFDASKECVDPVLRQVYSEEWIEDTELDDAEDSSQPLTFTE